MSGPEGADSRILRLADNPPLFVLELANNHMGTVEHGLRVIRAFKDVAQDFPYRFAFKFQYRHLDTFIHPAHRGSAEFPYVKRFEDTRLHPDELRVLRDELDVQGFIAICTPFDEESVDLIEKHDFDIVKVASCSFSDWPLLERVVQVNKPIIASTAGASLEELDRVVSFLEHRDKDFALMHCVAEYPAELDSLELNQIDLLKARYPEIPVGYSTHEDPANTRAVQMAVAKGATILEKHVGLPTEAYAINAYSATPAQVRAWVTAADEAIRACGVVDDRYVSSAKERASLLGLRRGVFAIGPLNAGHVLTGTDVFLAIPVVPGQLTANDLSKYTKFVLRDAARQGNPILVDDVVASDHRERVHEIIDQVKELLRQSGLAVPAMVDLEISHHYGLERFAQYGVTMLNVVNREYCKKLLIMLPGQGHPAQFHERKEETFHLLYGDLDLALDDDERALTAGDIVTIERGVQHAFRSQSGAVIEEISTTHFGEDSFYLDPAISEDANRKTYVTHWMA